MIGFGQYQYKLDSMTMNYPISFNFPEITLMKFEYDSQGNCNKIIRPNLGDSSKHIMNSVGSIIYSYDAKYTLLQYNTNNQVISSQYALLETNSQNIEIMRNGISFFDTNNNPISSEYEYTTLGNSIFQYSVNFSMGSGVDGKSKNTNTYDINNQIILIEEWDWDGSTYIPVSKNERYWQSGNLTSSIYYINPPAWEINNVTNNIYSLGDLLSSSSIHYDSQGASDTSISNYYYNNALMSNTASVFRRSLHQTESVEFETMTGNILQTYHYSAFTSTEIQEHSTNKELLKVTDLLGRETKGTKNEVLFYIYDDGTVEKRIVIE